MKTAYAIAPLVMALMAAVSTPATADDDRRGHRDRHQYSDRHDDRRDRDRRWSHDDRRWDGRRDRDGRWDGRRDDDRRWNGHDRRRPPVVVYRPHDYGYRSHGYGPPPWARGRDYRSYGYRNVYYVPYNDYDRYRLYEPRYGQRWIRDDRGNFLLVAAATGIITSILLNHGY